MSARQELLHRFVQISDLHVGEVDLTSGDATVGNFAQTVYSNFSLFDGLLGHSGKALQHLSEFLERLQDSDGAYELIVTGDFTRCGAQTDVAAISSYIVGHLQLHQNGNFAGLRAGKMPPLSVLGNHDHWGGRNYPIGGGPMAAGTLLPATFPTFDRRSLPYGIEILVGAVDSDADVSPWSLNRFRAIGSFQNQLSSLQGILPARRAREIRVLLCHHSYLWRGSILRMDSGSRQALEQFLVQNEFDLLLTGHTHAPNLQKFRTTNSGAHQTIHELRCGTTTQHHTVPLNWRKAIGGMPKKTWPKNTLLVHEIFGGPNYLRWVTQAFVREVGGFKNGGPAMRVQIDF